MQCPRCGEPLQDMDSLRFPDDDGSELNEDATIIFPDPTAGKNQGSRSLDDTTTPEFVTEDSESSGASSSEDGTVQFDSLDVDAIDIAEDRQVADGAETFGFESPPAPPESPNVPGTIEFQVDADASHVTSEFRLTQEDDDESVEKGTLEFDAGQVSDSSEHGTVDFDSVEASGSSDSGTVDLDASSSGETSDYNDPLTVAGESDQTMDFELSQGERRFGSDSGTIDLDINDADLSRDGRTLPLNHDTERITDERIEMMTRQWADSAADSASPLTSLKTKTKAGKGDSTLVIPERIFRGADEKVAKKADYDLLEILGEGGMGVVYAARQASVDRTVAVKMLKSDSARERVVRRKFLSEAVVTGDLEHPNIVPIYDVGAREDGALFYAMKRVRGTPWQDALENKTLAENLEILMKVADAVAFAHSKDVIHRDLKPGNVMLGGFGEVLVMDWGLAVPTDRRSLGGIAPSAGMGGTPAYMAPEMALGPFDAIGKQSDVYLLGAILFQVVTGKTPHRGKGAMACLKAAARNQIRTIKRPSELTHIALRAMATKTNERYDNVGLFQTAIRDYLDHAESISLSKRAQENLDRGAASADYDLFQRSIFAFEESYKLWSGNKLASQGIRDARLAYARRAKERGDLDLGLSQLDEEDADQKRLADEIVLLGAERDARQQRLRTAKRLSAALATALLVGGVIAFAWIYLAKEEAREQRDIARAAAEEARSAQLKEAEQRENAEAAKVEAENAREQADDARDQAEEARELAEVAEEDARSSEAQAVTARETAEDERSKAIQAKQQEEYESYIAQIGLAAAKIDENAFGYAREILEQSQAELRNWEWGRLMHMCSQSVRDFESTQPIESISIGPQGRQFAIGGWQGTASIWELDGERPLWNFNVGGSHTYAVAISPDGNWLVTATDDASEPLKLWNAASGQLVRVFKGHEGPVTSVCFSSDGSQMVSGSQDHTARIWDVKTGREKVKLVGHTWWVWDANFSADDQRVVTASHDGAVLIWSAADGQRTEPFRGHRGPVFAAAFSPDGQQIASGGHDRNVLLWEPSELRPIDYESLVADEPQESQSFETLAAHTSAVRCVRFSPNGRQLLTGGHDNTIRVWDVAQHQLIKTLRGHDSWVRGCDFTPDGMHVISAGHDHRAKLWEIDSYEEYRVIKGRVLLGHRDDVLAAGISQDGNAIVTASRDRTARTWDAETGQFRMTFEEGHAYLASTAEFFPDGEKLLTSALDNSTRIWDVATGVEMLRISGTGPYAAAALSPDGRVVLTGGLDEFAQLWDASSGESIRTIEGHKNPITATAISTNGRMAASGDVNGRVKLWSMADWTELFDLNAHTGRISSLVFSPDGKRLLSASRDNTVGQWDLASGKERTDLVLKHPDSVVSLDLSEDGRLALTTCFDGRVRAWDVATARVLMTLQVEDPEISDARFVPDADAVVTVHATSRAIRLWDLSTGQEISALDSDQEASEPMLDLRRRGALVWAARFTEDGRHLVTVGGNEARLWNLESRREVLRFAPHEVVASAEFSTDGTRIVTGGWDGSARIWNVETGKGILKLGHGEEATDARHVGAINSAVFSPDDASRLVLTASDDGTARSWNSETGELLAQFKGHAGRVLWAVFSADGERVLTTSSDKTARVWDADSGEMMGTLEGHRWSVLHGVFSTDGQHIVTGGADNISIVWDANTFEAVQQLQGHTASVTSVAVSPDGTRVLTASEDHTAKLWDPRTAKEILTLDGHTQEVTSVRFSADGLDVLTGSRDGTSILWMAQPWREQAVPVGVSDRPLGPVGPFAQAASAQAASPRSGSVPAGSHLGRSGS